MTDSTAAMGVGWGLPAARSWGAATVNSGDASSGSRETCLTSDAGDCPSVMWTFDNSELHNVHRDLGAGLDLDV